MLAVSKLYESLEDHEGKIISTFMAAMGEASNVALTSNRGEQPVASAWQAYQLSPDWGKWLPDNSAEHGSMLHTKICCQSVKG